MSIKTENENIYGRAFGRIMLALLCCLVWGSIFPVTKTENRLLAFTSTDVGDLLVFAGFRFFFAGILLVAAYSVAKKGLLLPGKKEIPRICVLGFFQTLGQFALYYISLARITGVKGAVITGSSSFFTILFACFLFHQEKFSIKKLIGCLIGFSGIIISNLNGLDFNFSIMGEGLMLLSAMMAAMASCFTKRYGAGMEVSTLIGYQYVFGGIYLILLGFLFGGTIQHLSGTVLALFVYLVIVSAAAQIVWSKLLKYNEVSKVAVFTLSIPMFGVLLSSAFIPGETVSSEIVIALVLVATGIIILNRNHYDKKNRRVS